MNPMLRFLTAAAPLAVLLSVSAARADVPPMCSQFDADTDCAAADVGKACADGSTCYDVGCSGDNDSASTVYKCEVCPIIVTDASQVCDGPETFGKPCGNGGTCSRLPDYCPSSEPAPTTYAICLQDQPTNPGGGGAGGADAGGAGGSVDGSFGGGGMQPGGVDFGGAGGSVDGSFGGGGMQPGGVDLGGNQGIAGNTSVGLAGNASVGGAGGAAAASTDDGSSGCAIGVPGQSRGALAGLITLASALALFFDRRRSRR